MVAEIFPPPLAAAPASSARRGAAYLLPMYLDLASEVGARSYFFYAGDGGGARESVLAAAVRDTMELTVGKFNRQAKLRRTRVSTPARDVYDALGSLLRAHRACHRGGRPLVPPTAFDGLPTLGGLGWLRGAGEGRGARPGAAGAPPCFYCNASAGCCNAGRAVDARHVYTCTACY